jgi:beta-carotene 3-hydroxylase
MVQAITLITFYISMEGVAWLTHKYIMHGFLWTLHRDHHKKEYEGFFERNDFFFLFFAIPGIICLIAGLPDFSLIFYAGIGITLYGFTYFLIHDVMVHQRFKILRKINSKYFLGLRRAHKMHHKHLNRTDGECFGLLIFPSKYYNEKTDRLRE